MPFELETVFESDSPVGAAGYSERPVFASFYAVAGRFVCVETSDPKIDELITRYFAGWHVTPVHAHGLSANVTIVVHTSDDQPTPPSSLAPFEVAEGGLCRTDTEIYFFENLGSKIVARYGDSPRVEVWIGNDADSRDRSALARLIFNAAMVAMRRCGLYELHAAGVVSPSDEGILVVGPSGSGKSNLAAQLASAGWQYLSDDTVLLYSRNGIVHAHALRRMFALTDEVFSAARLAESDSIEVSVVPFDPFKKRFEPAPVFPGRFRLSCKPTRVLFSRIQNGAATRLELLNRSETMARLIRMCPWACYDKATAQAHLEVLGGLARQADGFALLAGADLLNSERANEFLLSQFNHH
jgi:HPr kinase/phosphorylase